MTEEQTAVLREILGTLKEIKRAVDDAIAENSTPITIGPETTINLCSPQDDAGEK